MSAECKRAIAWSRPRSDVHPINRIWFLPKSFIACIVWSSPLRMSTISRKEALPCQDHLPKLQTSHHDNSLQTSFSTIRNSSTHFLRQLAASLNRNSRSPLAILPHSAKWGSAIGAMQTSIHGRENEPLLLNRPVSKIAKQRLREHSPRVSRRPHQSKSFTFRIRTNINLSYRRLLEAV